jgi:hypothetical protein
MTRQLCYLVGLLLLAGCTTLEQSTTHGLMEGKYKAKANGTKQDVYAVFTSDSMQLYALQSRKPMTIDTTGVQGFCFTNSEGGLPPRLSKTSLDIDLTTVLLKYRFKQAALPNQANANLNLNLYMGWRKDYYTFKDELSPLNRRRRKENHFQFDVGLFAGIGITSMNPSVTNNQIDKEYDGIVFQKGIAGFIGMKRITLGMSLGFDNLLDPNKHIWTYQQKPWIGLMLGINLGE